jgi:hypothetical protein
VLILKLLTLHQNCAKWRFSAARRWLPKSDKAVVIGIRQRAGQLRLIHAEDAKSKTVREILGNNLSEDVEVIVTDESTIYPYALNKNQRAKHKTICHKKEYVSNAASHGGLSTTSPPSISRPT